MESAILSKVENLIKHVHCCNSCLGRQFGNLLSGLSNSMRGKALKILLLMEWENSHRLSPNDPPSLSSLLSNDFSIGLQSLQRYYPETKSTDTPCDICRDILSSYLLDRLTAEAILALDEYEFFTFLVGSIFPPAIIDKEDSIRSTYNLEFGESIKSEFNREIGKRLQDQIKSATVDFKAPDIVVTFDLTKDNVLVKSNPLLILGRYRKLQRGIPQSKWFCRKCHGKGCDYCHNTGKMYQESVEEFISKPIFEITKGTATKFHGSGREDIDARMLGNGRPFVLEISEPRKRKLDFQSLQQSINENAQGKIEVELETLTDRTKVRELKTRSSRNPKAYRVIVALDPSLNLEESEVIHIGESFSDTLIQQRTPLRVAHRRADKIRARKIITFQIQEMKPDQLKIYIICEGGLYIKELISGDEGRTQPNLSERLNTSAVVTELDVVEVFSDKKSL
jgi:tRNA pseudouridine synthase 10